MDSDTTNNEQPAFANATASSNDYYRDTSLVSSDLASLQAIPPPSISLPSSEQQQVNNHDSLILSQARQHAIEARPTSRVTFQSPDWKTARRTRYDDENFAVDNRVRTPGYGSSAKRKQDHQMEEDDESQETTSMQYLPNRHLQPAPNAYHLTPVRKTNRSSQLQSYPQQQQPFLHSQYPPGQPYLQQTSSLSPAHSRPGNSIATYSTNYSSDSTRSRRSAISGRSSTSISLLHGEVINLEGDEALAAAVAASNRRRAYQQRQSRLHGINEDFQDGVSEASTYQIDRDINCNFALEDALIQPYTSTEEPHDDKEHLHHISLEGMEVGGIPSTLSSPTEPGFSVMSPSPRSHYHHQRHYNIHQQQGNGPLISWGIAAEYISVMRRHARELTVGVRVGANNVKKKTSAMTKGVLHYYRPPLSPRSRELKDLHYLQKSHKEKVGRWKIDDAEETGLSKDGIDKHDTFLNDENFCDFLLILTPQQVYRYWASLLDFREEHLGMMDSLDMWGQRLEFSSDDGSTDTTESRVSEEEEKNKSGLANRRDENEEEIDLHTDLPADYSTPLTGLLRRRGRSTPGADKTPTDSIIGRGQSLYSASKSSSQRRSQLAGSSRSFLHSPGTSTKHSSRMSMFERAIHSPMLTSSNRQRTVSQDYSMSTYTISENDEDGIEGTPITSSTSFSMVRRRWGNHTMPSSTSNVLSPPVRSLTRGTGSVSKIMLGAATNPKKSSSNIKNNATEGDNQENNDPNCIQCEEDLPNPVIPRGILVRTNGMLQFLSALKRGIVVRRHRANKEAIYCKIFSNDGGDTIHYHFIDPEEAMVAFKEQRVRYNRKLSHSSSPSKVRAVSREWSCMDGPADGSPVHKFKVPDHVAAQRYREKLLREHGVAKRLFDIATKAANSGMIRAADLVAVHPAYHCDPRHPGVRKGELGTASLRRSLSEYHTPHTFSLITAVRQGLKKGKANSNKYSKEAEDKWYKGEGSELHYKILDFEVATEGEYWLILRGFLHLHRDAAANRFAAKRSAGIGGGFRLTDSTNEEGGRDSIENRLQHDAFLEPKNVSWIEKLVVKWRKLDDTYLTGAIMPGAVPPPSDYFLGFKSPGTQIWSRLRLAGLETQRIYAVDTRRVMIKIRCPEDRLTDVAEVLRLKMETMDGSFAPFREDAAHIFKPPHDTLDIPPLYRGRMASLLRSKHRQRIIDFIIGSRIRDSGAELGQRSDVGKMIQARVPLHMPRKLDSLCNAWVYFWKREHWIGENENESQSNTTSDEKQNLVEKGLSPNKYQEENSNHNTVDERPIPNFCTRFFVEAFSQPLDAIEEYFGEQVTFYFAFLQHCAIHLLFLSFFGLIVAACQMTTDNFDHPLRPFYSMGVMLWTFIFLVNWRKRSNYLAYKWGSMDHKVQETTRPEFHGEYVVDPITNEWDIKYPKWKRWLKYMISIPITVFFTGLAVVLILLVHANRDLQMARYVNYKTNSVGEEYQFELKLDNIGHTEEIGDVELKKELLFDPTYWFIMAALPAMLGLCIPILNVILMKISIMLNDFENYRTESEYRTHLIIKVFSFRFVSQFGTVYYYAFISTGSKEAIESGIIRMGTSVMVYTTVAHWWNIILQVYFFMFIRYIRRRLYQRKLRKELKNIELLEEDHISNHRSDAEAREIRLMNKRMLLDQAQDDLWFEVMNPPHDSFPEYVQAVVQFSFVTCFSVVLPITPLLVLFNYLLSMRFDAYKLCRGRRRPLAKKTGGIGVWEHLLHIVTVIAVLTNCWLIAFTNSDFGWLADKVGPTATVFMVVAWEHVMLLIKYMMTTTISPFPKEIRDEMKRKQHDMEQERYATMRLKKERSRRSKFKKSLSSDFQRVHDDETASLLQNRESESTMENSENGSQISRSSYSALFLSETPEVDRRLNTITSMDEASVSAPGELYEC